MILIWEQDLTVRNGRRFNWRPSWFTGRWSHGRTWRLMWGLWSISYYASPGLRAFLDHVESGVTEWRFDSRAMARYSNEKTPAPDMGCGGSPAPG